MRDAYLYKSTYKHINLDRKRNALEISFIVDRFDYFLSFTILIDLRRYTTDSSKKTINATIALP